MFFLYSVEFCVIKKIDYKYLSLKGTNTVFMNIRYYILILVFILLSGNAKAQIYGCTDRLALNYNSSATINDGSCLYNLANIGPIGSLGLDEVLSETSGMILWNNYLWTHNDNRDTNIYMLDTLYGRIVQSYPLTGVENRDWEEISQDEEYVYIGDFGNNSGNRRDLRIYKISKASFTSGFPLIDSIKYSYSDQVDFTPASNDTDFDCEAFIVTEDSIYLFTKQWVSNHTSLYSLPKNPGNHIAKLRSSLDVNGLITGATYLGSKRIIALSGYSNKLVPFAYLLYDFTGSDFFGGNKRKIGILLDFHQIEAVASSDGIKYFMSNEHFSLFPVANTPQKIHVFNLSSFLGNYLNLPIPVPDEENSFIISPVPAHDILNIKSFSSLLPADYAIINLSGRIVLTGILTAEETTVSVSGLEAGLYILRIGEEKRYTYKVIKE